MDSSSNADFDFVTSGHALHMLEIFPNAQAERRSKEGGE